MSNLSTTMSLDRFFTVSFTSDDGSLLQKKEMVFKKLSRVKVFRDYETPVHLAGLEELVEDSPVLVLVTRHLALLLAGDEPDAVGAVGLEVDPRLTAAERNGSRPRAHYLSQVGCESSQGGRINGGEGDGGQRDRHEGNLLGDVVQKPLDLAILAAA